MGPDVLILTLWVCLLPATARAGVMRQLQDEGLEEQPCTFFILDGLYHVDCSDRGLSELPDGIIRDVRVQILDLSNNNFATFPDIEGLTKLQKLDISGNHLNQPLPSYIENWKYLHTLNLSNNNYETWMDNGRTYNIKTLDLSKNKIYRIEEAAIYRLKHLTVLDLSENRINELPAKIFAGASNLESLYLSRNYFSDVPSFISSSLKHIHLNSCQITNLNINSFAGMNSLLEVDLSINQIESIPDGITSNTLQELDLSYNEIATLTDRSLSSLPNLAVLNLRGNEFREIWPTTYFASNQYLREIHVKGNRWSCEGFSVNLLLTFDFLTKDPPKISDRASLICYSPSNVTQLSWQQAYIRTWHSEDSPESYTMIAIIIGIIIGVIVTSFVCRGLMSLNKNDPPGRPGETTVLNLNGNVPQSRVDTVVLRVPLHEEDLPPSYDEALLMPRLNSSFHSLPDFVEEEIVTDRRRYRRSRSIGDLTESRPRVADTRSVRRAVEIHIT